MYILCSGLARLWATVKQQKTLSFFDCLLTLSIKQRIFLLICKWLLANKYFHSSGNENSLMKFPWGNVSLPSNQQPGLSPRWRGERNLLLWVRWTWKARSRSISGKTIFFYQALQYVAFSNYCPSSTLITVPLSYSFWQWLPCSAIIYFLLTAAENMYLHCLRLCICDRPYY